MPLEESLGLRLLFALRGTRPPPADVTIVAMDKASARALGLHRDPSRWPRRIHARLLRQLAAHDPAVIAVDVVFSEPRREEDDRLLAEAIGEAGNVVLCAYLEMERIGNGGAGI